MKDVNKLNTSSSNRTSLKAFQESNPTERMKKSVLGFIHSFRIPSTAILSPSEINSQREMEYMEKSPLNVRKISILSPNASGAFHNELLRKSLRKTTNFKVIIYAQSLYVLILLVRCIKIPIFISKFLKFPY